MGRVSACKHGPGLARVRSQRINPFASMPAAKPIASAAGLIQAIKGAREPLLVAYTLMDNASMQRRVEADEAICENSRWIGGGVWQRDNVAAPSQRTVQQLTFRQPNGPKM